MKRKDIERGSIDFIENNKNRKSFFNSSRSKLFGNKACWQALLFNHLFITLRDDISLNLLGSVDSNTNQNQKRGCPYASKSCYLSNILYSPKKEELKFNLGIVLFTSNYEIPS